MVVYVVKQCEDSCDCGGSEIIIDIYLNREKAEIRAKECFRAWVDEYKVVE